MTDCSQQLANGKLSKHTAMHKKDDCCHCSDDMKITECTHVIILLSTTWNVCENPRWKTAESSEAN